MPTRKYTAAGVERVNRPRLGIKIEQVAGGSPEYNPHDISMLEGDEPSIDQLLAEAKDSLGRADYLARSVEPAKPRPSTVTGDEPSVFDSEAQKLARLGKRLVRPIPQAAEKAAYVGSFLAPQVAIPSQALIAAMSGKRLLAGEDEGALSTGLDVLGVVGGAGAALHGLRSLVGAKQAATAAAVVSQ